MDSEEYFFVCPRCGSEISIVLDTSVDGQVMIEDCEICCRPLEVSYRVQNRGVADFRVRPSE